MEAVKRTNVQLQPFRTQNEGLSDVNAHEIAVTIQTDNHMIAMATESIENMPESVPSTQHAGEGPSDSTQASAQQNNMCFEESKRRCDVDVRIVREAPQFNINEFKFPVKYMVWKKMENILKPVSPLLDPQTAHPGLILSEDRRTLKQKYWPRFTDHQQGFAIPSGVLSSEGFNSGRHYWEVEVEVEPGGGWFVGAVRESVKKSRVVTLQDGYWAVELGRDCEYSYITQNCSLKLMPLKMLVCLDWEAGQLSYYNADTFSHLHTFNNSFTEKMFPYFFIQNACIRIT
ncbi:zinc-binding protein A33-like [Protopterus annectens]|uniref:zinc-binding protein A33-like n=1 Tax=Protopterus annectens TaxID=7888 RepID=UPI001CFBDF39|nr:zinc-binding protein A33-like [Protopterus annectens]